MAFPTTHWSLLARASLSGDAESRRALEELCRHYWAPVFGFVRSRGISETDAQDVTQDFMVHVMERSVFSRADPLRGKFRSFLLGALVRFLADRADRGRAQKRGGTAQHLSLDIDSLDEALETASPPVEGVAVFDREWALAILENALDRLRREFPTKRVEAFRILKGFLPGALQPLAYEDAAQQLDISVPALKSEIHRLRRRFRLLVREEVGQTVTVPHEIDSEMAYLQQVLMDRSSEIRCAPET